MSTTKSVPKMSHLTESSQMNEVIAYEDSHRR